MWVCDWLCPKRKKKEEPYDVHEDTFEMDQHIGQLDLPEKHEEETKKAEKLYQQSSQQLTVGTIQKKQAQNQKKFIENKNKINEDEKPQVQVEVQKKVQNNDVEEEKKFVQIKNNVEQLPKEEQKKPVVNPNILNPKKSAKKKYNPDDYRYLNQQNTFKVKQIDSIKEQQYNIDGCKNCDFFIFDITANLYIDDSQGCFIFVAPCQSTIFVRNCKNMTIVAATGQFRTVQCYDCHFSLYCKSQPVIESSSGIHFSSFQCPQYEALSKQFAKLKRSPFNNHWSQIHNFTKKEGQTHHYLSRNPEYDKEVDWEKAFKEAEIEIIAKEQRIVPFIQGSLPLSEEETGELYLVVFSQEVSQDTERIIIWVERHNMTILKAEKRKFDGHGKNELVAVKLLVKQEIEVDFEEMENPTVFSGKHEVEGKQSKYFIDFGDER